MATNETVARGVRLPEETWRRIDEAAAELGMKPNEYLRRRLVGMLQRDDEVQNQHAQLPEAVEIQ